MIKTKDGKRFTNYYVAVSNICNKTLCNNIGEIDPSIWDNIRFCTEDEEGNAIDIYQYFITDCCKSDVDFLEKTFGLLFTYSNLLNCYVLCVDNFGTPWTGVEVQVLNDSISDSDIEMWEKR